MGRSDPLKKRRKIEDHHGLRFDLSKTNFDLSEIADNVFICYEHGAFNKSIRDLIRIEDPCPACNSTKEVELRRSKVRQGFSYHNTRFNIPESEDNVVTCDLHGNICISLANHFRYTNGGCRRCDSERSSESQRMDVSEFIKSARERHSKADYDYSKVHQFRNQHEPVLIICRRDGHGGFRKTPANHLHKRLAQGCPKCAFEARADAISLTNDKFLKRAIEVHEAKYDYGEAVFQRSRDKIKIGCKTCGTKFEQSVNDHLAGYGCMVCGRARTAEALRILTTEEVVRRCKLVWGDTYDYSKVKWVDDDTPIEIICSKHGSLLVDFGNHVGLQRGCKFCGSTRRLKQNQWLDFCGVPRGAENREVTIRFSDRSYVFVDGFVREENTVYEFNGDYFHGNPEKYGPEIVNRFTNRTMAEEFERTLRKRAKLESAGYRVVDIWESEWDALRRRTERDG